jgi:hypothetical protein
MTEDAEALRAEIEVTREELGETTEALIAKADVKGRAKEAVADAKHRATEAVADVKDRAAEAATIAKDRAAEVVRERPIPPLLIGAIGAAAIIIAIWVTRRRRS